MSKMIFKDGKMLLFMNKQNKSKIENVNKKKNLNELVDEYKEKGFENLTRKEKDNLLPILLIHSNIL